MSTVMSVFVSSAWPITIKNKASETLKVPGAWSLSLKQMGDLCHWLPVIYHALVRPCSPTGDLLFWPWGQKGHVSVSGGAATATRRRWYIGRQYICISGFMAHPSCPQQPGSIHLSEYCWVTDTGLDLNWCFTDERDRGGFGLQVVFHATWVVELFMQRWCWNAHPPPCVETSQTVRCDVAIL